MATMSRKSIGSLVKLIVAISLLLNLASCSTGSENQATRTAQAERIIQQATRQAGLLQSTDQAKFAGSTATHQANRQQTAQAELNQQATIDARAATAQADAAQHTAQALEAQQFILSAQNWPVSVADSFDQPAATDQTTYSWPLGSQTFPFGGISWGLEAGQYLWTATAGRGFAYWTYPTQQPAGDFYLAVDIQHAGGTSDSEAGLIFHLSDRDYWCYLISGEGDLFIGLRVNGEWQLSWPMNSSEVHRGQANHLAVINQNSQYVFLINGVNFISITNAGLPDGLTGLMINLWNAGDQASWSFDNFELRMPEAPGAPTAPSP